jgi:quinol monooxygenase YgiN
MSATVIVEMAAKPEEINNIIGAFEQALKDTRNYEGNQGVELFQNPDNPANMFLYETWESKEHHEKYLAWRTETGLIDALVSMLTVPPDIRYYHHLET